MQYTHESTVVSEAKFVIGIRRKPLHYVVSLVSVLFILKAVVQVLPSYIIAVLSVAGLYARFSTKMERQVRISQPQQPISGAFYIGRYKYSNHGGLVADRLRESPAQRQTRALPCPILLVQHRCDHNSDRPNMAHFKHWPERVPNGGQVPTQMPNVRFLRPCRAIQDSD